MSGYLITIDGGTTNTRVYLFDENSVLIAERKAEVGVRNTAISGSNELLKSAVREMINEVTKELEADAEVRVFVSGMLTSNVGLYELPHITSPACTEDFAKGAVTISMPDVCQYPMTFIPGMKNRKDSDVTLENLCSMDMMRGEEVQTIALLGDIPKGQGMVLVLPGSHTKVVVVDEEHVIRGCLTCMTGEMLQIMTQYSILADATGGFLKGEPNEEYLLAGYRAANETGSLSRAGFLTRICSTFVTKDHQSIQSFLLGAVLQNDIAAIRSSEFIKTLDCKKVPVRIVGKEPLASSIAMLMKEHTGFPDIKVMHEDAKMPLSAAGVMRVMNCCEH